MGTVTADGRYSVSFPRRWWYPACRSVDLRRRPVAITMMDTPLVLFRDGGGVARALFDRCPHRNVPLSLGRLTGDGDLQCGYHGWCFDGSGRCTAVPGLLGDDAAPSPAREVPTHATDERDGFVWVWGEQGGVPSGEPFSLPRLRGRGTGEVVFSWDLDCTLHAALENALDVPHTAFLHQGIFRGGEQREITAVRDEVPGGIEVQYLGEPVGLGPLRASEGAGVTFDHWDRFFLPSVAQVEYRVEGWLRITNTILHLPLAPFRTRAWFVVRYWTRLPAAVVRPIVLARGRQILKQDAQVLAEQTAHIRRLGGERYTSTALDLMGNGIWRLLRQAERAEARGDGDGSGVEPTDGPPDGSVGRRSVTFRA